jgi:hypothetical protein
MLLTTYYSEDKTQITLKCAADTVLHITLS